MSATSRKSWAETFRRLRYRALKEASANALRVFVALESWAGGDDGYAYPSISAIQEKTRIKKADTVSDALSELVALGIVYRRRLGSYTKGFIAPNLYRLGHPVVAVPERAKKLYYLIAESPRPGRVGMERYPEKGGDGPKKPSKGAANSITVEREESVPPKNGVERTPVYRGNALPPKTGYELSELELIEGGSLRSPPLVSDEKQLGEHGGELAHHHHRFSPNTGNIKPDATPLRACPVELRQDHATGVFQESETLKSGESEVPCSSLATIQTPVQNFSALRYPPTIAWIKKRKTLPPWILDETQMIFDSQGDFVGYVDRDGKRRNEWGEYESIHMAMSRHNNEMFRNLRIECQTEVAARADDEQPLPLTPDDKMRMLRKGAYSEAQAGRWSARTGVPAHVYLEKDDFARAELFKQWKAARGGVKK